MLKYIQALLSVIWRKHPLISSRSLRISTEWLSSHWAPSSEKEMRNGLKYNMKKAYKIPMYDAIIEYVYHIDQFPSFSM